MNTHLDVVNGSIKSYPSNGINFASAGSGVFPQTNQDEVINKIDYLLLFGVDHTAKKKTFPFKFLIIRELMIFI
ncbi:hypothetical protein I3842_08G162600 [Carya illinoinensis]|uniref:Uncharacterized protein n=1 Tax=Carya illinoinensis TaxID=32201 RepID=A0A922EG32_CARIL|nr:hypothetical protein I3842_08G162600 [Carya illinoinensis]